MIQFSFPRVVLIILITIFIGWGTNSIHGQNQMNNGYQETLNSYLIEFHHTPETCLATLDKFSSDAPEILNKIEWGCLSGDHTGYMIVDAKNEVGALQTLPASLRPEAKAEKVDKFTMAQIKSLHQQHN